jgi:hypothetical protein
MRNRACVSVPSRVGLGYFLDITGNPADHVDVAFFKEVIERVAHRTTDHDADAELFDLSGTLKNVIAFERNCTASDFLISARCQEAQLSAGVQDRGNPADEDRDSGSEETLWNEPGMRQAAPVHPERRGCGLWGRIYRNESAFGPTHH